MVKNNYSIDSLFKKQDIKKIIEKNVAKKTITIKNYQILKTFGKKSLKRFILSVSYQTSPKSQLFKIIIKYNIILEELEHEYYILEKLANRKYQNNFFKTAKPLFYSEKLSLFIYQKITFTSILNYLYSQKKLFYKIAEKIARGLSFFHQIDFKIPAGKNINYKKYLIENLDSIQKAVKKHPLNKLEKKQFQLIFNQVKKYIETDKFRKKSLIHGDFQTRNLLLSQKSFWVIDLARWGVFSPSYDLGTFLLQVDKDFNLFASPKEINLFKEHFLKTYQQTIKITPNQKKDINYFQAFICLQLIEYTAAGGPIYEIGEILLTPRSFTIRNLLKKATSCLNSKDIDLTFYKFY